MGYMWVYGANGCFAPSDAYAWYRVGFLPTRSGQLITISVLLFPYARMRSNPNTISATWKIPLSYLPTYGAAFGENPGFPGRQHLLPAKLDRSLSSSTYVRTREIKSIVHTSFNGI